MTFPALKDNLNVVITANPCGVLFSGTYGEYKLWARENGLKHGQVRMHALAPSQGDA
jgi:hypothetical protein